jgi:serine protease SohB
MFNFLSNFLSTKSRCPIHIRNLNDEFVAYGGILEKASGSDITLASIKRAIKRNNGRLFVLDFKGDVMATQARGLSEEITAIIASADPKHDEVLIRLESPGGAVHAYGYASSQLTRLKDRGIKLTIAVDKVAASGGYMMACIGDRIFSAPFAVVGSIGVVAEFMNFNQVLQDLGIDYRQYTAGKYKRTVSAMGPITEDAESKFNKDLQHTHDMFKTHIATYRPDMDLEVLATGEHWYGLDAHKKGLVDEVGTSEDYILDSIGTREVLHLRYAPPRPFAERIRIGMVKAVSEIVLDLFTFRANMRIG